MWDSDGVWDSDGGGGAAAGWFGTVATMTVRLTVDRDAWRAHVQATAAAYGHGLVPVVKGNGYGLGRHTLHEVVRSAGARYVCVGDVHELHDVPPHLVAGGAHSHPRRADEQPPDPHRRAPRARRTRCTAGTAA